MSIKVNVETLADLARKYLQCPLCSAMPGEPCSVAYGANADSPYSGANGYVHEARLAQARNGREWLAAHYMGYLTGLAHQQRIDRARREGEGS